jgi:hypothetical protein
MMPYTLTYQREREFSEGRGAVVAETRGVDQKNVRRPLSGLLPPEERVASIRLYRESTDGEPGWMVPILDSSAPGGYSTSNHSFLITGIDNNRQERMQLLETFGDDFVFFFGERAQIRTVQGVLVNAIDMDWKNEWLANYNEFLRGTRCVENRTRVYLTVGGWLYEGYIISMSTAEDAENPLWCPLSFQMLILDEVRISAPLVIEQAHARSNESKSYWPEYISDIGEGYASLYVYGDLRLVNQQPLNPGTEESALWVEAEKAVAIALDPEAYAEARDANALAIRKVLEAAEPAIDGPPTGYAWVSKVNNSA